MLQSSPSGCFNHLHQGASSSPFSPATANIRCGGELLVGRWFILFKNRCMELMGRNTFKSCHLTLLMPLLRGVKLIPTHLVVSELRRCPLAGWPAWGPSWAHSCGSRSTSWPIQAFTALLFGNSQQINGLAAPWFCLLLSTGWQIQS